jgi:predicted ribosome quality control (RQC) complex YloA/Tae2 family protein
MAGMAISEEEGNLLNEILALKVKNAFLTKKKRSVSPDQSIGSTDFLCCRVLTEELFQQYLEAENEPKKKKKVGEDIKKKKPNEVKKSEDELKDDDGDEVGDDREEIADGAV